MSIYEDKRPAKVETAEVEKSKDQFNEILYQFDITDSVIYLIGEIDGFTLTDIMTRVRTILKARTEENENDPINLVINSEGGCLYEMLGIVDYINSLPVKVNTICRGKAFSAAAVILALGTGTRYASKHSSIMFHQASSWLQGKQTDIKANIHHVDHIDSETNKLLSGATGMDAEEWEQKQRTDFWLSSDKALKLKVIDEIL